MSASALGTCRVPLVEATMGACVEHACSHVRHHFDLPEELRAVGPELGFRLGLEKGLNLDLRIRAERSLDDTPS